MGSKIYIDEEVGYLEAWEALVHLTDDWICGGNVSHETIMNMRDVIAELRGELAEYVELHSKVADELGTANYKLMQIEDLAKRESGLTPRAADECPQGGSHVYKWDGTLPTEEMVECEKCGHRR